MIPSFKGPLLIWWGEYDGVHWGLKHEPRDYGGKQCKQDIRSRWLDLLKTFGAFWKRFSHTVDDERLWKYEVRKIPLIILFFHLSKKERREALVVLCVCTCTAWHFARDSRGGGCLVRRGILQCWQWPRAAADRPARGRHLGDAGLHRGDVSRLPVKPLY